ncbi:MAG: 50S ribosomal protein L1 [Planctomycetes bacterium]|nr:50S ribosomal protein L1 [Planctomycetota bacterium]
MRSRSKRYNKDAKDTSETPVALDEAIKRLKSFTKPKFDQSVDLVCHLGIDPKQADQMIRGSLSLPKGVGKTKRVIAFCPENEIEAAKAAGAIEAGADELVAKVAKGWTDFDVAVAHPSVMGKVGKLGRVLGPLGKMPSPKSGTVTPKITDAIKEYAAGKVEFRNDSGANVHAVVGKISFPDEDLKENIVAFVGHMRKLRPQSTKGTYLKRICLSGTMTPSVTVDKATIKGQE